MDISLHLLFDADFSAQIEAIWTAVAQTGIGGYMADSGNHPHVSLAVYKELALAPAEQVLRHIIAVEEPPQLTFASLGQFLNPAPVLFAAPVVTPALLALHERVHAALTPFAQGARDHYLPGQWVPHCTLALDVAPVELSAALAAAQALSLPLTAAVVGIEIVGFRPVAQLAHYDWPTRNT